MKDPIDLRIIKIILLVIMLCIIAYGIYYFVTYNPPAENKFSDNGCPTFIICENKNGDGCIFFSLIAPIIYTIKDNPVKEYYAILDIFWVNGEDFEKMQCYDNEDSAQAAGYQPSEQAKKGIEAFERLN